MATTAFKDQVNIGTPDAMLEFGSVDNFTSGTAKIMGYSASYTDGIILNLGNTDLEGMSVIIQCNTALTGTGTTSNVAKFEVQVSNDNGSNWTTIAEKTVTATEAVAGAKWALPIPRGHVQGDMMRVKVTATATGGDSAAISTGKFSGWVDTFAGV